MLADTDAVRALGHASAAHAADLAAVASMLSSVPASATVDALGAVGARFVAALCEAVAVDARAVAALSDSVAGAATTTGASARAYDDVELRAARLLTWRL